MIIHDEMKTCPCCMQEKHLSYFYKRPANTDGYYVNCKACTQAKRKANCTPEMVKAANAKQYARLKAAGLIPDRVPSMTDDYHVRHAAQHKVRYALKVGKLLRQPCEVCGCTEVIGHHDDYAKPLDVRWLCHKHHREFHSKGNCNKMKYAVI